MQSTSYAGGYDLSGRQLTRRADGHRLEIRDSERAGPKYTSTYLQDLTLARYVSNLWSKSGRAEFEFEGIRYAIEREGRYAARIDELYRYKKGGSRRRDRDPVRRDRGQLSLFTS